MKRIRNQNGFAIGAILLVVALIAIVAAAFVIAGRTSSATSAEQSSKVMAATMVQQGINMRNGFDKMLASGLTADTITWDTTAVTGIFNPTDGGAVEQFPQADALLTTTNQWVYKISAGSPVVKIKGIGIDATADNAVVLVDLKAGVCQQINKLLYGSTAIPAPAAGTAADWGTAATAIDLSADAAVEKKPDACIKTTDAKYVYYKVLREQ